MNNKIVIKLNSKDYVKDIKADVRKKIDKSIKEQAKDINEHFKVDGWDLAYELYRDTILADILGHNVSTYIMGKLLEQVKDKRVELIFREGDHRLVFSKRKKK